MKIDRCVLINLARRPDRLASCHAALRRSEWPFPWPETFAAVDGHALPIPDKWRHVGPGGWGCFLSHMQIIARAIQDGIQTLMVLEDDAIPVRGFSESVRPFLAAVPSDWELILLGGEHQATAESVCPGVVRSMAAQRNHAYICRPSWMRAWFAACYDKPNHIDWTMAEIMPRFRCYAPERWLVAQAGGMSDISGRMEVDRSFNPAPTRVLTVVGRQVLPDDVAERMLRRAVAVRSDGAAEIPVEVIVDEMGGLTREVRLAAKFASPDIG